MSCGRTRGLQFVAEYRSQAGEKAQLGRFLKMVVEHKHKIGFTGTILIEPKPHEPTKHQYDFDVETVYGFLLGMVVLILKSYRAARMNNRVHSRERVNTRARTAAPDLSSDTVNFSFWRF